MNILLVHVSSVKVGPSQWYRVSIWSKGLPNRADITMKKTNDSVDQLVMSTSSAGGHGFVAGSCQILLKWY